MMQLVGYVNAADMGLLRALGLAKKVCKNTFIDKNITQMFTVLPMTGFFSKLHNSRKQIL